MASNSNKKSRPRSTGTTTTTVTTDGVAENGTNRAARNEKKHTENGSDTSPVAQLAAMLAGGNLSVESVERARSSQASDEERRALSGLYTLARSMRRAVGRLQRAADSVESIAGRVLEGGRVLARAVEDEAASVDQTVSSIAEISSSASAVAEAVGALSNLAQTTSTSSLEMAASIDEVSASADALNAFVEETAASIEEMAASIRNVAASTESLSSATDETERSMRAIDESTQRVGRAVAETAALAEEVQRSAEVGSAIVLDTAESMRATRRGTEEASETISALGERSERIGQITRVIDEIAGRTNLLALNARILAAQAGSQGRGFAVVAEEIKELSERTARSTDEIDELIKGVRESVVAAMQQAASNRELADEGVRLAERAAESLHEISQKTMRSAASTRQIAEAAAAQSLESHQVTELVSRVRRRMEEIERATSEQARTAQSIGERGVHMAGLTQQVSRAAEEQAEGSKHIAQAMEQLTEVVSQIATAVGEQHRGAEDALRAVEIIRDSVQGNQAAIVEMNYTAGMLDAEASALRNSFEHFQLPEPRRGGSFACGVPDNVPSLDMLESSSVATSDLLSLSIENLVSAGMGAEVVPALAESWRVSTDGRTYKFYLRAEVRFHNNRLLTPGDVIYSVRRVLRESQAGAWVYMNLVGAKEFAAGETEELPGARLCEDGCIELELVEPLAFFLPMLCAHHAGIVPREEIEVDGGASFLERPIGTGPFRLTSYDVKSGRVKLTRFKNYWNKDKPYIDEVTMEYSQDGEELFERLRAGELGLIREEASERVRRLSADAEFASCIVAAPQLHTQMLFFDAEQAPFNDARVRRAVAHAINKEQLVEEAYGSLATAAAGPIPPGLLGYDANYQGLEYDPQKARRLLREAGHSRGFKIEFWRPFSEQAISHEAGRIMCNQLDEVGIKCELQVADKSELLQAITEGRVRLAEISWYADYADADNFTYVLFNSNNRHLIFRRLASDAKIDELTVKARTLINRVERAETYARLQRMIAEEALCAFLTHRRAAVVHGKDVEGLHVHLVHPLVRPQEIWLAGEGKEKGKRKS